ncbi:MAG TPA: VC0807 family protein [Candidatus Didemnitutus sp.]|nr:VC0807 family protein [Candidatus Didemnitutus sp.]
MSAPARPVKPENLIVNLVCNVALPTAIMSWCSGDRLLGPKWALIVALLFPIGYGIHDFAARRRVNFISIIGFASVLISGGFGLMKLDGFWFAVKDGALPALIGVAVLASMRSKEPLVHEILYNPQVIDTEKVGAALAARGNEAGFDRLMRASSYLIAGAMLVSAVLNYGFARYIIRSPAGTEAFNRELARMHWVSLLGISVPVIAMMMYALWRLLKGLEQLTGLTFDEIMKQPPANPPAATPPAASDDTPDRTSH